MSKKKIMITLFNMKKRHEFFTQIEDEEYGADDLLSMACGREVSYEEAAQFVAA